jgi:hypothetical protein
LAAGIDIRSLDAPSSRGDKEDGELNRMRLFRTIMAVLITVALAALPVGASAAALSGLQPGSGSVAHAHAEVDDEAAVSIGAPCHQHDPSAPAPKHDYKCPLGFCCVGAAAAIAPISAVPFKPLPLQQDRIACPTELFVPDHAGSPPFRPPRV